MLTKIVCANSFCNAQITSHKILHKEKFGCLSRRMVNDKTNKSSTNAKCIQNGDFLFSVDPTEPTERKSRESY